MIMSLECPFCGAEDEDCVSDVWEYDAGEDYEVECGSCEKEFILSGEATIDWSASKPDCDGNHEFGDAKRYDCDKKHHEDIARIMNRKPETEYYSFWARDCANCDASKISEHLPLYADKPEDF